MSRGGMLNAQKSGPSFLSMPRELPPFVEKIAISSFESSCKLELARVPGIFLIWSTSDKNISQSFEIKIASTLKVAVVHNCLLLVR
jgi:hypothetical protein